MTAAAPRNPRPRKGRGGLPDEDDDLDAFAQLANAAFPGTPARDETPPRAAPATPVPLTAVPGPFSSPAPAPSPPAPAPRPGPPAQAAPAPAVPAVQQPGTGTDDAAASSMDDFVKQSTFQVDADVKKRFTHYRDTPRPALPNAEVVFRAVEACEGRYREIIEQRKPQLPEGRRFGRAVPGRRPPGTRLTSQINYRPTVGEERDIESLARESGAASVSAFLNAVLDEFLPPAGKSSSSTRS